MAGSCLARIFRPLDRSLVLAAASAVGVLMTGCASQKPVSLDSSFWEKKEASIGIAVAKIPAASAAVESRDGGISGGFSDDVSRRLEKEDFSRIYKVGGKLEDIFKAKGLNPKVVSGPITMEQFPERNGVTDGYAERDFSALGAAAQAQYLLLIQVQSIGTIRGYLGALPLIPTTSPSGYFVAAGQLVDLKTQKLLWRKAVAIRRPTRGEWDQPPDFANLIAAVHQAVDSGMDLLVLDFSWSAK
jgi:hypothetical protein